MPSGSLKAQMGQKYEDLRKILESLFPGAGPMDDAIVDRMVNSMQHDWRDEYAELGVPPPAPDFVPDTAEPADVAATATYPVYLGTATHQRFLQMNSDAPMQSKFDGYLPLVRVPLPASFPSGTNPSVKTQLGTVYFDSDHLVGSVELVAEKYADSSHLGYTPARVDLITPARQGGARFGAIAMYLIYRNADDTAPSAYLLEAGMATGQASVLFFGQTMDTVIFQPGWYTPTPFSEVTNWFRGRFSVVDDQPVQMVVDVFTEQNSPNPFVTVTVDYQPLGSYKAIWPALLTLEAAQRVALIAKTMNIKDAVPLQFLLAEAGKFRPWLIYPHLGPAASAASAS